MDYSTSRMIAVQSAFVKLLFSYNMKPKFDRVKHNVNIGTIGHPDLT